MRAVKSAEPTKASNVAKASAVSNAACSSLAWAAGPLSSPVPTSLGSRLVAKPTARRWRRAMCEVN